MTDFWNFAILMLWILAFWINTAIAVIIITDPEPYNEDPPT